MRLDPELLDGSPAAGARVLALGRLADAEEAAARLADPADAEALHDFRVAIRRTRSTLRLLSPALKGALTDKQLRRLAKVARRTGPARDGEVLIAWLDEARGRLGAPYRGALDWLLDRLELRRAAALPRFHRLAPRLTHRLSARPGAVAGAPASLAALLAVALRTQARALREALGAVVGGEDAAGLHRARIEGKRLRYLLEPLRGVAGADAAQAVEALKGLQDLLGTWHDRHLAREALAGALVEAAADRARRGRGAGSGDLRPGLLALDQLAARDAAEAYGRLAAEYLQTRATAILDLAYAVVAGLEGEAEEDAAAEVAPERRFLLAGLPPETEGGEVVEAEQGWLPGEREHVGVVRSTSGEGWFRARPAGRGRWRSTPSPAPTSRPGGRSPRGSGWRAAASGWPPSPAGASTSSPTAGWRWRWWRRGPTPRRPPGWSRRWCARSRRSAATATRPWPGARRAAAEAEAQAADGGGGGRSLRSSSSASPSRTSSRSRSSVSARIRASVNAVVR
jgi:CHAD domain-containing protein